jgi:coenzyme PQQ synthesis protein D (PqqD)
VNQLVYGRADVLWRRTLDRVVILVPASGEFLTLQATGSDLWSAIEPPAPLGEVAERLAAIYGAPTAQIVADIEPVLQELRRRGAVAVSPPR